MNLPQLNLEGYKPLLFNSIQSVGMCAGTAGPTGSVCFGAQEQGHLSTGKVPW